MISFLIEIFQYCHFAVYGCLDECVYILIIYLQKGAAWCRANFSNRHSQKYNIICTKLSRNLLINYSYTQIPLYPYSLMSIQCIMSSINNSPSLFCVILKLSSTRVLYTSKNCNSQCFQCVSCFSELFSNSFENRISSSWFYAQTRTTVYFFLLLYCFLLVWNSAGRLNRSSGFEREEQ